MKISITRNLDVFPSPRKKEVFQSALQLFPDNFDLLNQLVPLLTQNGLKDEATRLLDATEKCPLTTAEQQQLERLKTTVSGRTSD